MGPTDGIKVVQPFLFALNFEVIQGTGGGGVLAVQEEQSALLMNPCPLLPHHAQVMTTF